MTTTAIVRILSAAALPATSTIEPSADASRSVETPTLLMFLAAFVLVLAYLARRDRATRPPRDIRRR